MQPFTFAGTRAARALLVAALFSTNACGKGDDDDDSSMPPASTDLFVGTWAATATDSQTVDCGGLKPTLPLSDIVISKGTADQLTLTEGPCTLTLSVSGHTATALPGQSCTVMQQLSGTLSVSSYSFTTGDGKTATRTADGSVTVTSPLSATCTYTAKGELSKR